MRVSDLLLYALLLGAIMLFNLLRQLLSRRRRQQPEPPPPIAEQAPTEEFWGRTPATLPPLQRALEELPPGARRPGAQPREMPAARRLASAREAAAALSGSRRGLRQGMVALAVLGPCRALSPYDERGQL